MGHSYNDSGDKMTKPALVAPHARADHAASRFALRLTAAAALAALSTAALAQQTAAPAAEKQLETVVVTGARASAETALTCA